MIDNAVQMFCRAFFVIFKKNLMRLFFTLLIFTIFFGCQSDNRANPRAYVEGNVTSTKFQFDEIIVIINSENTNIAETIPGSSGNFILSGPLLSDTFSLVFNAKIKSFKSSKSGCNISADGLQIMVPAGITYLTFTEIILE